MLKRVGHQHGDFRFAGAGRSSQPAYGHDFVFRASRSRALRHQRHFPVVIDEAFPQQPGVRDTRTKFIQVKKSQVHAAIRKRLVKLGHRGFVLGTDRPNQHLHPVFRLPR